MDFFELTIDYLLSTRLRPYGLPSPLLRSYAETRRRDRLTGRMPLTRDVFELTIDYLLLTNDLFLIDYRLFTID